VASPSAHRHGHGHGQGHGQGHGHGQAMISAGHAAEDKVPGALVTAASATSGGS